MFESPCLHRGEDVCNPVPYLPDALLSLGKQTCAHQSSHGEGGRLCRYEHFRSLISHSIIASSRSVAAPDRWSYSPTFRAWSESFIHLSLFQPRPAKPHPRPFCTSSLTSPGGCRSSARSHKMCYNGFALVVLVKALDFYPITHRNTSPSDMTGHRPITGAEGKSANKEY